MVNKYNQGPQSVRRAKKGAKKKIKRGVPFRRARAAQRTGKPLRGEDAVLRGAEEFDKALPTLPKTLARKSDAGRHDVYNVELATEILHRIANGETLTTICAEVGMPHPSTVLKWVLRDKDFEKAYQLAREIQYDVWGDQTRDIADNVEEMSKVQETVGGKDGNKTVTTYEDAIEHRKLKITTRQWLMARGNPRKYGDKLQTENRSLNLNVTKIEMVRIDGKGRVIDAT